MKYSSHVYMLIVTRLIIKTLQKYRGSIIYSIPFHSIRDKNASLIMDKWQKMKKKKRVWVLFRFVSFAFTTVKFNYRHRIIY